LLVGFAKGRLLWARQEAVLGAVKGRSLQRFGAIRVSYAEPEFFLSAL
jgi:hypothetical protein